MLTEKLLVLLEWLTSTAETGPLQRSSEQTHCVIEAPSSCSEWHPT